MSIARSRGAPSVIRLAFVGVTLASGCNALFDIKEGKPQPTSCQDHLVIDDLEDGDGSICASDGRQGAWYTVGDGTGTNLTPTPGADFTPTLIPGTRAGTSRYAARLAGSGFTNWGALMGLNLNVQGLSRQTYDAGTAGGIRFW
ncbi:MAG TPA: hypothetical protein VF348_01130, partial [Usitatibacter sp.]